MSYLDTVYSQSIRPKTGYPRELARHIIKMFQLRNGMSFLDVGCGRGDFAEAFLQEGLQVHCTDQERSRDLPTALPFTAANFLGGPLPYPDNTFDVVFSKSVIEHFSDPERFVSECLRVLKVGGRIICLTPDWMTTLYVFYDDHTHQRPFTVSAMRDLLTIMKVREVSTEIFYQLPVLWRHPWLIVFSKLLQLGGPVKKLYKNKFIRWSRELMVIGSGIK